MLSGGKGGKCQNCSVLYCVLKWCTVISTLRRAVLKEFSRLGFVSLGPFTVPRFFYVCLFFLCYLVILHVHMCCIIVTWWGGPGGIEA